MKTITKNFAKETVALLTVAAVLTMLVAGAMLAVQPMPVEAANPDNITVNLTVNSEITLNCDTSASGGETLGLTNDTYTSSANCNVITSDSGGYTLTLANDDANDAMQSTTSAAFFTDYVAGTAGTPESWSVTSAYEFGFSAFGDDTDTGTYGTDTDCDGSGDPAGNTSLLYRGFTGTTDITVANASAPTNASGTDTMICFGAEQNGVQAPSGNYSATIVATATTV